MKAYTIRNIDDHTYRIIQQRSQESGLSMNKYMIRLIQAGSGIGGDKPKADLTRFFGSWPKEVCEDLKRSLKAQRKIDAEVWA